MRVCGFFEGIIEKLVRATYKLFTRDSLRVLSL